MSKLERIARALHDGWMEHWSATGLRYGPRRSETTHPHLVPWDDLAEDDRAADRFIAAVVLRDWEQGVLARADLPRAIHDAWAQWARLDGREHEHARPWDEVHATDPVEHVTDKFLFGPVTMHTITILVAGALFMSAVRDAGALLLPVDSEHNAIFQCLPVDDGARPGLAGVDRILLTASGGPFRSWDAARIAAATPDQACAHPNWSMGRKISVDSATLMNKGLELAEACWLFGVGPGQVTIVVHPQSVIHSLVQYRDGSVLAQLGNPDMRTPIAYGLGWPERLAAGVTPLDLIETARLDFEAPDEGRFPCLRIAREAIAAGGTTMAACNAANEIAVAGFLDGAIGFMEIPAVIEETLARVSRVEPESLAVVEAADSEARQVAGELMRARGRAPLAQSER